MSIFSYQLKQCRQNIIKWNEMVVVLKVAAQVGHSGSTIKNLNAYNGKSKLIKHSPIVTKCGIDRNDRDTSMSKKQYILVSGNERNPEHILMKVLWSYRCLKNEQMKRKSTSWWNESTWLSAIKLNRLGGVSDYQWNYQMWNLSIIVPYK